MCDTCHHGATPKSHPQVGPSPRGLATWALLEISKQGQTSFPVPPFPLLTFSKGNSKSSMGREDFGVDQGWKGRADDSS